MKSKFMLFVYSFVHAVVDMSCGAFMYGIFYHKYSSLTFAQFVLLYDFLAFVLQLPFGRIFNNKNQNSLVSMIGCILILFAYLIRDVSFLPVFFIGIGNALFHVGGGIDILNISQKKAAKIGIYVAPGALGLFLGVSINQLKYSLWIIIVLLLISILLLYLLRKNYTSSIQQKDYSLLDLSFDKSIVIYMVLFTICIRGYFGFILNYSWKSNFLLSFLFIIMIVLGKAFGGILSDKFGIRKISFLSLVVSSILFIFSFDSIVIAMISIFLFNMTMPITLILLSNSLKNYGMAFGLNTCALFFGYLPYCFGFRSFFFERIGLFFLVFISYIFLLIYFRKEKKL